MKIDGLVTPVRESSGLKSAKVMCYAIMNDRQVKEFEALKSVILLFLSWHGEFRINAFVQQALRDSWCAL